MRELYERMRDSLQRDEVPEASWKDFPCFAPAALAGNPHLTPSSLQDVLSSLSSEDIPTLQRCLDAIDAGKPAWLGFKIVYDADAARLSRDTEVVGMIGEGSADAQAGIFFVDDAGSIVFSRRYSERDRFQMLDITRGPGMHDEQYDGVAWLAVPLVTTGRVFILGAGNVSAALARICDIIDFQTVVVDYDEAFLNVERFPLSRHVLIDSFDSLGDVLDATPADYICVLTRGHMYDPEGLAWGLDCGALYVGMMGCAEKNARVMALLDTRGYSREKIDAVLHAPIGLEFGAKTSAELALCIAAQLVEIRTERRGLPLTHS